MHVTRRRCPTSPLPHPTHTHLVVVQNGKRRLRGGEEKVVHAEVANVVRSSSDNGAKGLNVGEDVCQGRNRQQLVRRLHHVRSMDVVVIEKIRIAPVVVLEKCDVANQRVLDGVIKR